jgi:uncharacterized protein (DUF2141 family)
MQSSIEEKNLIFFSKTSNHFSIFPLVCGWLTLPSICLMWFFSRYFSNSARATYSPESFTVSPERIPTTLSLTTLLASSTFIVGGSTTDAATLSGGVGATGTVTFYVYSGSSSSVCAGTPVATIVGSTFTGTTSTATISGLGAGSYEVQAVYYGNSNNAGATNLCGTELLTVVTTIPEFPMGFLVLAVPVFAICLYMRGKGRRLGASSSQL